MEAIEAELALVEQQLVDVKTEEPSREGWLQIPLHYRESRRRDGALRWHFNSRECLSQITRVSREKRIHPWRDLLDESCSPPESARGRPLERDSRDASGALNCPPSVSSSHTCSRLERAP